MVGNKADMMLLVFFLLDDFLLRDEVELVFFVDDFQT